MTLRGMVMTIEEEIEEAILAGAHPLLLHGIISLVEQGYGALLTQIIDEVGQRLYLQKEKSLETDQEFRNRNARGIDLHHRHGGG